MSGVNRLVFPAVGGKVYFKGCNMCMNSNIVINPLILLTYFFHHFFCPDHLQNIKKDSSSLWPQHLTNTSSQLSGFFMTHWKYEALEPFLWGWWSGLSVLLWWTRLQEAQTKYVGPKLWNLEAFNELIMLCDFPWFCGLNPIKKSIGIAPFWKELSL